MEINQNTLLEFGNQNRINQIDEFIENIYQTYPYLYQDEIILLRQYLSYQLKDRNNELLDKCCYNIYLPFESIVFNLEELLRKIQSINPRNDFGDLINEYIPVEDHLDLSKFEPYTEYLLRNNLTELRNTI
jgi:hypothetical protein